MTDQELFRDMADEMVKESTSEVCSLNFSDRTYDTSSGAVSSSGATPIQLPYCIDTETIKYSRNAEHANSSVILLVSGKSIAYDQNKVRRGNSVIIPGGKAMKIDGYTTDIYKSLYIVGLK